MANLATKDGLITFAGINSSLADQEAGNNEHLRSFVVEYPHKHKTKDAAQGEKKVMGEQEYGKITFAGKASMFEPVTAEARRDIYQRLLRFSPVRSREASNKRIGAITTGFGRDKPEYESEIVVFDATMAIPKKSSILARITPKDGAQAHDLAINQDSDSTFSLAYCTDYQVFLYSLTCDFSTKTPTPTTSEPSILYNVPVPTEVEKRKSRPRLTNLHWLSPNHLLLLQNTPVRKGAELLILRLHPSGGPGSIIARKRLPGSVKETVRKGLAVCLLDADPATGERQIVIAIASSDTSIHVYTLNHQPSEKLPEKQISKPTPFTIIRLSNQHEMGISKITLSAFFPPRQAPNSVTSIATSAQYIRLASVGLQSTVVVDTLALTSIPTSPAHTSDVSASEKEHHQHQPSVRWILSTSSTELLRSWTGILVIAFAVLISAFLLQNYLNPSPSPNSAVDPSSWSSKFAQIRGSLQPPGAVPPRLRSGARGEAMSDRVTAAINRAEESVSVDRAPGRLPDTKLNELRQAARRAGQEGAKASPDMMRKAENIKDSAKEAVQTAERVLEDSAKSGAVKLRDVLGLSRKDGPGGKVIHVALRSADGDERVTGSKVWITEHEDENALRVRGARRYEELGPGERAVWREILKRLGEWAEEEGEGVLRGVMFGV